MRLSVKKKLCEQSEKARRLKDIVRIDAGEFTGAQARVVDFGMGKHRDVRNARILLNSPNLAAWGDISVRGKISGPMTNRLNQKIKNAQNKNARKPRENERRNHNS